MNFPAVLSEKTTLQMQINHRQKNNDLAKAMQPKMNIKASSMLKTG